MLLPVGGADGVAVVRTFIPDAVLTEGVGWGEFYIFCCVLSWVAFSLIGKTVLSGITPLVSVTYSSAVGALALFIPAYLEGIAVHLGGFTAFIWLNIVYLGLFGTVIGFIWYYEGIKAIGPTKAGLFINFVPVSAIVLAFFSLGEPVTLSLLVGALLVSGGVYLTNMRPGRVAPPVST